jgi:hypothetical protein
MAGRTNNGYRKPLRFRCDQIWLVRRSEFQTIPYQRGEGGAE